MAKLDPVSTALQIDLIFFIFALLKEMKDNMQRPGTAGSVFFWSLFTLIATWLTRHWQSSGHTATKGPGH